MMYNVYEPGLFGLHGSPDVDESLAVLAEVKDGAETGNALLCYIYRSDPSDPPMADLDMAEKFVMPERDRSVRPVFENMQVNDDGTTVLQTGSRVVILSEEQERMLACPGCINTSSGKYYIDRSEREPVYRKDESFESIPGKKLDMREFARAVSEKYPALLEKTHTYYGNTYPMFPNAKYFEDRDKMVVFIAKSQLGDVSESVLDCKVPLFRDMEREDDWDLKNTYGICIIDDTKEKYSVSLISPFKLDIAKDRYLAEKNSKDVEER